MNPVARARHVLARRPWLYWSAVLALAAFAGWSVAAAAAGVDEARRAWGATRDVVVATDDPFLPPAFLREAVVGRIDGARLAVIHGAGHYVQVERPDETAAVLEAFLAGLGT